MITYETQDCLVVPFQEELSKEAAQKIQTSLLEQVHVRHVKGVIVDLSGVQIIDSILWKILLETVQMIKILGFPAVITGLNPGVVASIIDLDLKVDDVTTTMSLEDALTVLVPSNEFEVNNLENAESEDVVGYDFSEQEDNNPA
ncbi:STAS domain-containing protein [Psychromonas aquimarina]|uniref:STAS domain-containing protein n=1 Tax=Psychromonas aquimarina TaxID=444919 RepID=UPI0004904295|nr:STAS domain-containing protein [Psychromonas aquimarina]